MIYAILLITAPLWLLWLLSGALTWGLVPVIVGVVGLLMILGSIDKGPKNGWLR